MRIAVLALASVALVMPAAASAENNDQRVADLLARNLQSSETLKGFQVKVQYRDGIARLIGWVRNQEQMKEALAIAMRTPEVNQVMNFLKIHDVAGSVAPATIKPKRLPKPETEVQPRLMLEQPSGTASQASDRLQGEPLRGVSRLVTNHSVLRSNQPEARRNLKPIPRNNTTSVTVLRPRPKRQKGSASQRTRLRRSAKSPKPQSSSWGRTGVPAPNKAPRRSRFSRSRQNRQGTSSPHSQFQAMPVEFIVQTIPSNQPGMQHNVVQRYVPQTVQPGMAQLAAYQQQLIAYHQQLAAFQQQQQQQTPMPIYSPGAGGGTAPALYDQPNLPNYAWPSYAAYPNYAALTYPKQYSPTAWPYIGPFYPYPQVPLGWRKVTLEWDDGWWYMDFSDDRRHGGGR